MKMRQRWPNPILATIKVLGVEIGLPAIPIFELIVGLVLLFGAIYWAVAVRGKAAEAGIEADTATGEAVIG